MTDPFKQLNWNKLEQATRNESARSHLKLCLKILGLQEDVELIEVKDKDRFILSYDQDLSKPEFGKNMIRLETLMRQTMGVVVDLRLEAATDRANRKGRRKGRNGSV